MDGRETIREGKRQAPLNNSHPSPPPSVDVIHPTGRKRLELKTHQILIHT